MLSTPHLSDEKLSAQLGFNVVDVEDLLMVIQHPLSTEASQSYVQMRQTMDAVRELGLPTVIIFPNSDAGSFGIIKAVDEMEDLPHVHIVKNLPRIEFVNLMRRTACLIGNSSAGILEAPLLGLPVVNVGRRQLREAPLSNVDFVDHKSSDILKAIRRAVYDKDYIAEVKKCQNPYGDGKSSEKIASVLASIELNEKLLIKDITF